jgi:hypothetical protein
MQKTTSAEADNYNLGKIKAFKTPLNHYVVLSIQFQPGGSLG